MRSLVSIALLDVSWGYIAGGTALFLASFVLSIAVIGALLVTLPATYFLDSHDRGLWIDHHPVVRWTGIVLKNLLGIAIILLGAALSLPGIPGQGLLTILIGLVLLDFPGKRRLERRILQMRRVLQKTNSLRQRFGRQPLILDEDARHHVPQAETSGDSP
jgi:hypothetical protein